jgi:hypothetical protein
MPEQLMQFMNRGTPMNFTTIAEMDGTLDPKGLAGALEAVRQRHPLLAMCIVPDGESYRFAACDEPIALTISDIPETEYMPSLLAGLLEPFNDARGPLARCVYLRHGEGRGRLLLTLHHCIGDGRSGILLIEEILRGAANGETLAHLPPAPSLWDARPAAARGLRGALCLTRGVARDLYRMLWQGAPKHLAVEPAGTAFQSGLHVLPVLFDAAFTTALTQTARSQHTTVHAIMSAVVLQALAVEHGGTATLTCASPVDLRSRLACNVDDHVGFYVGMARTDYAVMAKDDPWPLARAIRADILVQIAAGTPIQVHAAAWLAYRKDVRRFPDPVRFVEAMHKNPGRAAAGITNLGRLKLPETYGAVRLTAVHFAVSPSPITDFSSTATCFAGRLHWNFSVKASAVSFARAKNLVRDVSARLHQAV